VGQHRLGGMVHKVLHTKEWLVRVRRCLYGELLPPLFGEVWEQSPNPEHTKKEMIIDYIFGRPEIYQILYKEKRWTW